MEFSISDLWEDLKSNPLVLASIIVVLLVLIYIIRSRMTKTPVIGTATSDGIAVTPPVPITYNNTYNSYPVAGTAPSVVTPPVVTPPITCPAGYHLENGKCEKDSVKPITCPAGYHLENGKCEKNSVTPPVVHLPPVISPPVIPSARYVTVTHWPEPGSSLWSIAQLNHTTLAKVEALNPQITNPDLIYPGQRVRVS